MAQLEPAEPAPAIMETEEDHDVLDEFHSVGVFTIAAGHVVHHTHSGFLQPLLPTFIEKLALTNAQAGLLTVFLRWPSLFRPLLGYLVDKISLRPFFILAPTVTGVTISLLDVPPSS